VSNRSAWHHHSVTDADQNVPISLIWPEVEELPVLRANQFLGQISQGPTGTPEEFILTIGYVVPPVLLGTVDEQRATMRALGAVSVKALSRVSMSRGRLGELIQILQSLAEAYDKATGTSPS
jgi:hypothetical protein